MSFHVGQKVVCVEDRPHFLDKVKRLDRGAVYTIREEFRSAVTGRYGVFLNEVVMPRLESGEELGWLATRFRPVQERKTDISVFTKLLVSPPKVKEPSPVVFSDQEPVE